MIECLTFVVPTYRTAATLPQLIDRIVDLGPGIARSCRVVVIDDACPDRSGDSVAGRSLVDVYRFDTNRGQRTAVLAGLSLVSSEVACVLDADLQDDPTTVADLVAALVESGADVVCAGRAGDHESGWRRAQAWMFRHIRWAASRGRIPPNAGLFHVARIAAIRPMLTVARPGDDPLVAYARSGATIASVPSTRGRRMAGTSSYTAIGRLRMATRSLSGLFRPDGSGRHPLPVPSRLDPLEFP